MNFKQTSEFSSLWGIFLSAIDLEILINSLATVVPNFPSQEFMCLLAQFCLTLVESWDHDLYF